MEGGCKARDKVTVYVLCNNANVFIPNTFSPNGDGANDIFYPRGNGVYSIKMFRIFNRWGEVVFETTDLNKGWDGTFNGKPQPMGVYVYVIEAFTSTNDRFFKQGNVTLIR